MTETETTELTTEQVDALIADASAQPKGANSMKETQDGVTIAESEIIALAEPNYAVGYYHPTERFLAVWEHVSVMDTSKTVPGADGELVALFGPSQCGGATEEEANESRRQAQLFTTVPDLLEDVRALATLVRFLDPRARRNVTPDGEEVIDEILRRADADIARATTK